MAGSGLAAAAAGIALTGVLGIAMVGGALGSPTAATATGLPGGLKAGTVPAAYTALITAAGGVCPGLPAPVIAAQIQAESGWNPAAVSPVGAEGISQFMPATWGTDTDANGTSSPSTPGTRSPPRRGSTAPSPSR